MDNNSKEIGHKNDKNQKIGGCMSSKLTPTKAASIFQEYLYLYYIQKLSTRFLSSSIHFMLQYKMKNEIILLAKYTYL